MTLHDPHHGKPRGEPDTAIAVAESHSAEHIGEVRAYLRELYRLAPQVGLDPAILTARSVLETGYWSEPGWVNKLNPGAIGSTEFGATASFQISSPRSHSRQAKQEGSHVRATANL
jgi:hypothetical protein